MKVNSLKKQKQGHLINTRSIKAIKGTVVTRDLPFFCRSLVILLTVPLRDRKQAFLVEIIVFLKKCYFA